MSKKLLRGVLCAVLIFALLRACGVITVHEHDWQAATCTAPRICSVCDAEDGEPPGHTWSAATCASYQTCQRCGTTGGQRLDHAWADATCTEPEHCSVCGEKRHWYSMTRSHDYSEATCTEPEVCSVCGEIGDGPTGHYTSSYGGDVIIDATCQSDGLVARKCWNCEAVIEVVVPTVPCNADGWTTIREATPDAPGIDVQICVMCGAEIDRMERQYLPDLRTASTGTGIGFNTYDNEAQQQTSAQYVLNARSGKFHLPSCRDVPKISPANYSTTNRSRSDLIAGGWDPCGHCSP